MTKKFAAFQWANTIVQLFPRTAARSSHGMGSTIQVADTLLSFFFFEEVLIALALIVVLLIFVQGARRSTRGKY